MTYQQRIFTIGHSTHSLDRFISLLQTNGITAVADVRSSPFSRHTPQFNKDPLRTSLKERGIQYVFLGRELGARSADPNCFVDGRVQYSQLAETSLFEEGIRRVTGGAQTELISLMCAEKDPLDCHRTLLVARQLVDGGAQVDHILSGGSIESHGQAMLRLLDRFGMQETSLFLSPEELIAEAMAKQEERIPYVDADLEAATDRPA